MPTNFQSEKAEWKGPLDRLRPRCEDNTNIYLDDVDRIDVVQDKVQGRDFFNTVISSKLLSEL